MAVLFYNQWYDVFNNFSPHAVEFEGEVWPTAEHAYQAAKCADLAGKAAILRARSPLEAKGLADVVYRHGRRADWSAVKLGVMEGILRAKLAQHAGAHI